MRGSRTTRSDPTRQMALSVPHASTTISGRSARSGICVARRWRTSASPTSMSSSCMRTGTPRSAATGSAPEPGEFRSARGAGLAGAPRLSAPRRVEALRSHIQTIVDGLLDAAAEKGEFDVVVDLGYELPVTVICEMLGVPKEDRHLFHEWSSGATRLLDGVIPAEDLMAALGGAMQIINYLNGIIERRRRSPGDDLLSALIAAEEEGQ